MRLRHSDFVEAREYLDVPVPSDAGPLSVDPPSIAMISGKDTPARAHLRRNQGLNPRGTSTLVVIYSLTAGFLRNLHKKMERQSPQWRWNNQRILLLVIRG